MRRQANVKSHMFCHALNPTAHSLFVQQGNNRNDLVPIAICCSLLDAGLDWACNSFILLSSSTLSFSSCHGQGSASLGGLTQCAATGSGL